VGRDGVLAEPAVLLVAHADPGRPRALHSAHEAAGRAPYHQRDEEGDR
jgi:hypothetical protein